MANPSKRLKPYIQAAEAAGWTVEISRNGHFMFYPPRGTQHPAGGLAGPVKASASPSDVRAHKNMIADLRRLGLNVS